MFAMRHGSSGRCWKPRSKATSSPTSRCATRVSTVRIRVTICDPPGTAVMLKFLREGLRRPVTGPRPPADPEYAALAASLNETARRRLGHSLAIRQVDAGSCNGCELEIHALNNAFYDLERFGIHFVASPRHADVLLVTGPVTNNMRQALERTWRATPDPQRVVAVGDSGAEGGIFPARPDI